MAGRQHDTARPWRRCPQLGKKKRRSDDVHSGTLSEPRSRRVDVRTRKPHPVIARRPCDEAIQLFLRGPSGLLRSARNDGESTAKTSPRHCEEPLRRSNPALPSRPSGLLRSARNDGESTAEASPRHCEEPLRRSNPGFPARLGLDASAIDARAPDCADRARAFARPAGSIRVTKYLSSSTARSPDGAKRAPGRLRNESKPLIWIRFSSCVPMPGRREHRIML